MIIVLNYTLVIPDFSNAPPGPQMVTAPFTASANFSTCFPDATTCFNGNFLGAGTVTVTLQFLPGLNINANTGTVFDFAAIPESSTMELTILGLAAFTLAYIGPLKRRLIGKVSHL
jgi:hypothetical protein